MCLNCGCGEIDNRHDNDANIVAEDVRQAAAANDQDVATAVRNMHLALDTVDLGELVAASGRGSGMGGAGSTTQR